MGGVFLFPQCYNCLDWPLIEEREEMADNASQRAIEIDRVLHRLQNHPDSIQMLSQVELLQQEVKELVPRLRQPILQ